MNAIELARNLGKALQADPALLRLADANAANDADTQLAEMIDRFNAMRAELNGEIMKPEDEKDQDLIMKLDGEFRSLYGEIMTRPTMVEFSDAKADADKLLAFVMKIINESVNGENPDTIEEDQEDGGCGGSCSSCKGCH